VIAGRKPPAPSRDGCAPSGKRALEPDQRRCSAANVREADGERRSDREGPRVHTSGPRRVRQARVSVLQHHENADSQPPNQRLKSLHLLLPRLYAAALALEDTSVLFDEDGPQSEGQRSPARDPSITAMPAGLAELADYLGPRRFYREIFDPYADPTVDEVGGDLIDDFADIHGDLARGLAEWQAGSRGEALWEWRFNFEVHWGEHATSALRALYALSRWRDEDWPTA
jgi:hypothetical protein